MESPRPLGRNGGRHELVSDGKHLVPFEASRCRAKEPSPLTMGLTAPDGSSSSSSGSGSPARREGSQASSENAPRSPEFADNMTHWFTLCGAAEKPEPVPKREGSGGSVPSDAVEALRQLGRGWLPGGRRES